MKARTLSVKGAINSPFANTASAAYYSLQFFLAPEAPSNWGMFAPIRILIPDQCWLNAKWPSPTIACTTLVSSKVTSAIWQALANAIPERVTGSTFSEVNWFVAATTDRQGRTNVFSDLPSGGWGGTPYGDGMNVTQDPLGNCMNMPAESAELFYPIEYEAYELRPDSAGAGKFRGGLGAVFKCRFLCDGELSMETSRTRAGSPGVNGGGSSIPQRASHVAADGTSKVIGGIKENGEWTNPLLAGYRFGYDEQFVFETTGGGWGKTGLAVGAFDQQPATCRRMINAISLFLQYPIKCRIVLAEVMEGASQSTRFCQCERGGAFGGE